ncbi:HAD family acid phosphatase [Streptacidiphilus melanogenes]|uniref:HAD family acid phosphatase n=1 Tax=Streptacidiphilus melanogenes TaxID=411235 RepID=UPI000694FC0A|nr:HAD family acid phosphatase [Streptacidiphilus melanogenes]
MARARTLKTHSRTLATLTVGVAVGALVGGGSLALAGGRVPTSDKQITNMTDEVNEIKAYYGDTVDANGEHWASPSSNYAIQVQGIEAKAEKYLAQKIKHDHSGKRAVVLDVDDTALSTYNYELETTFVYNPASNAQYIATKNFPAVFGMNNLANWARTQGYTVFYITGRPESQRADTVRQLTSQGYPDADDSHLFLKNTTNPPTYLATCATPTWTCTTTQYKSGTRAYLASQGWDITANFGDQYSDLNGGYSEQTYKLPNPMYYLP